MPNNDVVSGSGGIGNGEGEETDNYSLGGRANGDMARMVPDHDRRDAATDTDETEAAQVPSSARASTTRAMVSSVAVQDESTASQQTSQLTTGDDTVTVAHAVILDDDTHPDSSPHTEYHPSDDYNRAEPLVVQAIPQGPSGNLETVHLDSSHIVSVRQQSTSQRDNQRPEFVSVILANKSSYAEFEVERGILGINLLQQHLPDPQLSLSHVDPSSPFAETAVQVGDNLISINNTPCQGMDPDSCLAVLLSSVTNPANSMTTTVRWHNRGGCASQVVTTAEKAHPTAKVGVGFGLNSRGSLQISSVAPDGVLASSLLNPGDRILSVNGHDCTNASTRKEDVVQWITQAPRRVTIVTETSASTGVVIAAGDAAPYGGVSNSAANGNEASPARTSSQENQGAKICGVMVVVIFIIVAAAIVSSTRGDDDGFGVPRPSPPNFPTAPSFPSAPFFPSSTPPSGFPPSPTPPLSPTNDFCFGAIPITVDGRIWQGSNQFARPSLGNACEPLQSTFASRVWYTFTASDDADLTVSTCENGFFFDTFLSVLSGDCRSLTCVGTNDDGSVDMCSLASAVDVRVTAGQTYFVVVQGAFGAQGSFRFKVERSDAGIACRCPTVSPSPSAPPLLQAPVTVPSPAPS